MATGTPNGSVKKSIGPEMSSGFLTRPTAFAFAAAVRHTCRTLQLFTPDVWRSAQNWRN
jgi:hypothetical protein